MNYADLLSNRPFASSAGGVVQNPYARLMQQIMGDIRTFRQQFPREGGDGMKPMQQNQGMRRTPPLLGYGQDAGSGPEYARRSQPTPNIVNSTFGNGF